MQNLSNEPMSTSSNDGTSDLATGSPTEPDEFPIDWSEWMEVPEQFWPSSWPDSEMTLDDEVEG